MNNVIKILLFLFFAFLTSPTRAQSETKPFHYKSPMQRVFPNLGLPYSEKFKTYLKFNQSHEAKLKGLQQIRLQKHQSALMSSPPPQLNYRRTRQN